MIANEAWVARGTCRDAERREILMHMPTQNFFNLHTLDPNAPQICSGLCLDGYFALLAWGLDLQQTWEALNTLGQDFRCQVGKKDYHPAHKIAGL